MRRSLTLIVVAMAAVFPSAADATWPGEPGPILYEGLDDADDEGARDGLYSIAPDGSGNRRIARRVVGGVASSRDARRIAFFRTERQLWQARSDGSQPRLVLRLQRGPGSDAAWSPRGDRLVFTLTAGDERQVWIVGRGGNGLRRLVAGHSATWTSRGRIAYAENDGAIATIRPSGRGRRIWVPQGSPVVVGGLDASPDGRRLVYQQGVGRGTIRTVDLRTGRRTRFRDGTKRVSARDVAWAPGGDRLAFVHTVVSGDVPNQLRTIRPDGTALRTIFEFPSALTPFYFVWQTR